MALTLPTLITFFVAFLVAIFTFKYLISLSTPESRIEWSRITLFSLSVLIAGVSLGLFMTPGASIIANTAVYASVALYLLGFGLMEPTPFVIFASSTVSLLLLVVAYLTFTEEIPAILLYI